MLTEYTNIQYCIYANAKYIKSLAVAYSQSSGDNWEINKHILSSISVWLHIPSWACVLMHPHWEKFASCRDLLRPELSETWPQITETSAEMETEREEVISKLQAIFWSVWQYVCESQSWTRLSDWTTTNIWVSFFFYSWNTSKMGRQLCK